LHDTHSKAYACLPSQPPASPTWQHHAAGGVARQCGGAGLLQEAAGVEDHQVGGHPHAAGRREGTGRGRLLGLCST
jgi:hypothetical protein